MNLCADKCIPNDIATSNELNSSFLFDATTLVGANTELLTNSNRLVSYCQSLPSLNSNDVHQRNIQHDSLISEDDDLFSTGILLYY